MTFTTTTIVIMASVSFSWIDCSVHTEMCSHRTMKSRTSFTVKPLRSMDNVLVICAHADDEVLGAGGSIIHHVNNNDDVAVVVASNRAKMLDQLTIDEKFHAALAKSVLGYSHLEFLDLHDEHLMDDISLLVHRLEIIFDKVKPTIVYTHHAGDANQDHKAIAQATEILCRPKHRPPRKLFCYETISSTDQSSSFSACTYQPNHYTILTKVEVDRKIEALQKYAHELEEWPKPRCAETVETYAKFRGTQCGKKYAEALMLMREIN